MISDPYDDSVDPRLTSNFPLSEQFRLAGQRWVELEKAASLLERTVSACFAQRVVTQATTTISRAEMLVRSSPEWMDHLNAVEEARGSANLAEIEMEVIRMRSWEQTNKEANRRKEMGL